MLAPVCVETLGVGDLLPHAPREGAGRLLLDAVHHLQLGPAALPLPAEDDELLAVAAPAPALVLGLVIGGSGVSSSLRGRCALDRPRIDPGPTLRRPRAQRPQSDPEPPPRPSFFLLQPHPPRHGRTRAQPPSRNTGGAGWQLGQRGLRHRLPPVGQTSARCDQALIQIRPDAGRCWTEFVRGRPKLACSGRTWPNFGQFWAELGMCLPRC